MDGRSLHLDLGVRRSEQAAHTPQSSEASEACTTKPGVSAIGRRSALGDKWSFAVSRVLLRLVRGGGTLHSRIPALSTHACPSTQEPAVPSFLLPHILITVPSFPSPTLGVAESMTKLFSRLLVPCYISSACSARCGGLSHVDLVDGAPLCSGCRLGSQPWVRDPSPNPNPTFPGYCWK